MYPCSSAEKHSPPGHRHIGKPQKKKPIEKFYFITQFDLGHIRPYPRRPSSRISRLEPVGLLVDHHTKSTSDSTEYELVPHLHIHSQHNQQKTLLSYSTIRAELELLGELCFCLVQGTGLFFYFIEFLTKISPV